VQILLKCRGNFIYNIISRSHLDVEPPRELFVVAREGAVEISFVLAKSTATMEESLNATPGL
jgi:hypothetical protein